MKFFQLGLNAINCEYLNYDLVPTIKLILELFCYQFHYK